MSDIRAQSRRDAEFDRLVHDCERPGEGCYYDDAGMQAAYVMGKRHGREEGPAWHDYPTCPGKWACGNGVYTIEMLGDGTLCNTWDMMRPGKARWYGPIPADEVKPL